MSSQPIFPIGALVRVVGTFKSLAGDATDPDIVHFRYQNPVTQVVTTLTYGTDLSLVRTNVGVYEADVDTTPAAGEWAVEWVGTGSIQASDSGLFRVTPSRIT